MLASNQAHLIGNGECVTRVHAVVSISRSSLWKRGDRVQGNVLIAKGTVIAKFDSNGRYGNYTNGTSHAAIYLGQTLDGITVIDQWNGHTKQPPHRRTIHFRRGHGTPVNPILCCRIRRSSWQFASWQRAPRVRRQHGSGSNAQAFFLREGNIMFWITHPCSMVLQNRRRTLFLSREKHLTSGI
ncbi:hypothetical protein QFZ94_001754 [Paraburkholderia sp. JPY465]|uniref:BPSL0067 family protein n=1 Tax=Paraburkholderia sp. JPY465 TaxID=3042285 RepID=UPI003D1F48C2